MTTFAFLFELFRLICSTAFANICQIYITVSIFHCALYYKVMLLHDDVFKWKHFPRYCPFVRGIHRSPVNSPHKGQGCGDLMVSFICAWINAWVNNRNAGDLRLHRAHYDVIVMRLGWTIIMVQLSRPWLIEVDHPGLLLVISNGKEIQFTQI